MTDAARDAHRGNPRAIIEQAAAELAALELELKALARADNDNAQDTARGAVWARIGRLQYWLREAPKNGK
jgi:hypothetical protein